MPQVTLTQILLSRDARVQRQKELRMQYGTPLICFTMNIPGPVKCTPLILRAFREGASILEEKLPENAVLHRELAEENTGCYGFYAVAMDARELKEICTAIEDAFPMGRLFDMDVLDENGTKLERPVLRSCMVCGAPGRGCAARRLHSVSLLQAETTGRISAYFEEKDRDRIACLASDALIKEVRITPKPGLVDRRNNGSHRDMDLNTFVASAKVLKDYFKTCVAIGQQNREDCFPALQKAGLLAEESMLAVTGGVNTHKGAIFTLGILCGALGQLWTPEGTIPPVDAILSRCATLSGSYAERALENADDSTPGLRLYRKTGLTGIRGEVAAGLPSVWQISLPIYQKALADGSSENDAGVLALLSLIARVEDTNLYHRGGPEGASFAKEAAGVLLREGVTQDKLEALDDAFIARNLSPGGCADLLAVTLFLHDLAQERSVQNPFL